MTTLDHIAALLEAEFGIPAANLGAGTRLNETGLAVEELPDLFAALEADLRVEIDIDGNPLFRDVASLGDLASAIDAFKRQRAA